MTAEHAYRVVIEKHNDSDYVLWSGREVPTAEIMAGIKDNLKQRNTESTRSPFEQRINDSLLVQRRRSLGWKTINIYNLYRD